MLCILPQCLLKTISIIINIAIVVKCNQHRSGKRGLISQGTSKINLNCSVCIKAIKCLKTDYTVIHNLFLPTIAKNSWDINLWLSKNTKHSVTEKLKEGAGSRHIIDSFRESEMNNGIFRDHLITKKEHENIARGEIFQCRWHSKTFKWICQSGQYCEGNADFWI